MIPKAARDSWFLVLCAFLATASASGQNGLEDTEIERAIERALPSVVIVSAKENTPVPNEFIKHFGAGVVLDRRGFVLICEHLVTNANSIVVTLPDGSELPATLVASEKNKDIALVKVAAGIDLPVMPIGQSTKLKLGSPLISIGNAMGDGMSVSQGILSARLKKLLATNVLTYENVLQTDAGVNPGNSGGVLINRSGEMVGFVVAMRANAQRMGYAVSVETIRDQLAGLLRSVYATETKLGFSAKKDRAALVINNVSPESAHAGILKGDRIRQVGLQVMRDDADFELFMLERNAGEIVPLQLERVGHDEPVRISVFVR